MVIRTEKRERERENERENLLGLIVNISQTMHCRKIEKFVLA